MTDHQSLEDMTEALSHGPDERGLRVSAYALDQMLAAAVVHTESGSDPLPPCDAVLIRVVEDGLELLATDRSTFFREYRDVVTTGRPTEFLLQRADVRTFRSLLRTSLAEMSKETKQLLPVDVHVGDTGFLEVVLLDRRAIFTPRPCEEHHEFPIGGLKVIETTTSRTDLGDYADLNIGIRPDLVSRLQPLQKGYGAFRFRKCPETKSVLATPLHPHTENLMYSRYVDVVITTHNVPSEKHQATS